MKTDIDEVIQQLEVAERVLARLRSVPERMTGVASQGPERGWLAIAEARLGGRVALARAALEDALALPELKAIRLERQLGLEQAWVESVRQLFGNLVSHVGQGSPLVEALFPHLKFEKLERGGNALRTYRGEFALRRASTYVRRLAVDPEYPFLAAMLASVDSAADALSSFETMVEIGDDAALALRENILAEGDALGRVLRQARALSEAALVDQPELFTELGFDERVRKRSSRPVGVQAAG